MIKYLLALLALIGIATSAALADAGSDLKSATAKFAALKSYRSKTLAPGGQTITGEFVNPDRSHVTAGPFEMVTIGDTLYVKHGAAWQAQPLMPASEQMSPKTYATVPETAVIRDLGMKTIDGAALHAYDVQKVPSAPVTTIYIDANGLPARIEANTPRGKVQIQLYDFNAPISIVAPN